MAVIHLSSLLLGKEKYKNTIDCSFNDWDSVSFAEPLLLERVVDVMTKFLDSERKDSHVVDPNVWNTLNLSCVKIPLYCTSFASVVAGILRTINQLTTEQFSRYKGEIFPLLCALVKVQSREIRNLVHDVLL